MNGGTRIDRNYRVLASVITSLRLFENPLDYCTYTIAQLYSYVEISCQTFIIQNKYM